jgi:hypothetical protein
VKLRFLRNQQLKKFAEFRDVANSTWADIHTLKFSARNNSCHLTR